MITLGIMMDYHTLLAKQGIEMAGKYITSKNIKEVIIIHKRGSIIINFVTD